MRLALLAVTAVLFAGGVRAGDWEREWSLGGAQGSKFTVGAPFEFDGLAFRGPYSACPVADVGLCRSQGLTDAVYAREDGFTATLFASLELRRRLSDSLAVGVGAMAGVAPRKQRLFRGTNGNLDPGAPAEPEALFDASQSIRNFNGRTNGVGAVAYLSAGLRFEKGFERRTAVGYRGSSVRLFADAGGGVFPLVPGKNDADLGVVPGIHFAAGLRFQRGSRRALTVSLVHTRAVADTDHLQEARLHWTGLRVGWVSER